MKLLVWWMKFRDGAKPSYAFPSNDHKPDPMLRKIESWSPLNSSVRFTDLVEMFNNDPNEEFELIAVPKGTCLECRGMKVDPTYGNDVPCYGCGGTGKRREFKDDSN